MTGFTRTVYTGRNVSPLSKEKGVKKTLSLLYFKSILSMVTIGVTLLAAWSMLEITGKQQNNPGRIKTLKGIHRAAAFVYISIYLFVAYFCIHFVVSARSELSPRANLHSLMAITLAVLIVMKIVFVRVYRQYYGIVRTIGLIIVVLTFNMVLSSGGYYLLATGGGKDKTFDTIYKLKMKGGAKRKTEAMKEAKEEGKGIRKDLASIERGKVLFKENCSICHNAGSTRTLVGPGLKGILKNPRLPVSGKPAIPENVKIQLRTPYQRMPSFSFLAEEDVESLIAYLATL